MACKFKNGDNIIVIKGKDAGKQGKILKIFPKKNLIVVEGINIAKRHQKPSGDTKGGIVEFPAAMSWSKVKLLCPFTKKPTRVSFTTVEGKKMRKSKVSGEVF